MRRNTITVGERAPSGGEPGSRATVRIAEVNWLGPKPSASREYRARVRYREPLGRIRIRQDAAPAGSWTVRFTSPRVVAPGQSLVLYDGDKVAGGGVIQ